MKILMTIFSLIISTQLYVSNVYANSDFKLPSPDMVSCEDCEANRPILDNKKLTKFPLFSIIDYKRCHNPEIIDEKNRCSCLEKKLGQGLRNGKINMDEKQLDTIMTIASTLVFNENIEKLQAKLQAMNRATNWLKNLEVHQDLNPNQKKYLKEMKGCRALNLENLSCDSVKNMTKKRSKKVMENILSELFQMPKLKTTKGKKRAKLVKSIVRLKTKALNKNQKLIMKKVENAAKRRGDTSLSFTDKLLAFAEESVKKEEKGDSRDNDLLVNYCPIFSDTNGFEYQEKFPKSSDFTAKFKQIAKETSCSSITEQIKTTCYSGAPNIKNLKLNENPGLAARIKKQYESHLINPDVKKIKKLFKANNKKEAYKFAKKHHLTANEVETLAMFNTELLKKTPAELARYYKGRTDSATEEVDEYRRLLDKIVNSSETNIYSQLFDFDVVACHLSKPKVGI